MKIEDIKNYGDFFGVTNSAFSDKNNRGNNNTNEPTSPNFIKEYDYKFNNLPFVNTRIVWDTDTIKNAINAADRFYLPNRVWLQNIFLTLSQNAFVTSCILKREELNTFKRFAIGKDNKNINEKATSFINVGRTKKEWFKVVLKQIIYANFYGYSVVKLFNDRNKIDYDLINRILISPDTYSIRTVPEAPNGQRFDRLPLCNEYCFFPTDYNIQGTKTNGWGLFFHIMYEYMYYRDARSSQGIFLDNFGIPPVALKFKGSAVDVVRDGFGNETTKESAEFREAKNIITNMKGNSRIVIPDTMGEIVPIDSTTARTDLFAGFIEEHKKDIVRLVFGHPDAMFSKGGALGATQGGASDEDGQKSEVQKAISDKEKADLNFILEALNNDVFGVIGKLRSLGVPINPGEQFICLDDGSEQEEKSNKEKQNKKMIENIVLLKQAGLVPTKKQTKIISENLGIEIERESLDLGGDDFGDNEENNEDEKNSEKIDKKNKDE